MNGLLHRFGVVCWWFGALIGGSFAVSAVIGSMFARSLDRLGDAAGVLAFGLVLAALCWAAAFVLAGSFWRPPQ